MQGKLNIFQRTMLQWNDMHPFNAVHVARIAGTVDLKRLTQSICGILEARGLVGLKLDRRRGTYEYTSNGQPCEIRTLPEMKTPPLSLEAEIARQLNTGFPVDQPFVPFRFFVAPDHDSFALGLAYFHAVADAESVVELMKAIIEAYQGKAAEGPCTALDLYPARRDGLLDHSPRLLARKLLAMPRHVKNIRTSCRPAFGDKLNMENGFSFLSLGPAVLGSLSRAGKSWQVTLNDLFLALLMKCFSPLAERRARAPRRQISLGSIVNLRRDLGLESKRNFGLFLGSFVVSHEVPNGLALPELARDIRRQTARIKRDRIYLSTPLELALARRILPFFSPERRRKFYSKNYPLWGGITNVNLNPLWDQPVNSGPLDYFRAVSTGPVTPLVFSVTTLRDRLNIALTYRTTVFSPSDIENLRRDFLDALSHLDGQA